MKQPKISLIVIYNNANNLKESFESIAKQSFTDIEVICINNASADNAEEIAGKFAENDDRFKLISLPLSSEIKFAKQAGLGIASGDFICFINGGEVITEDFIKNLYFTVLPSEKVEPKNNHLYRRAFLENDNDITQIIQDKINAELEKSEEVINKQKQEINEEFNKFYQTNIETIKNSSYEVICRFNQLEKLFYEKDYEYSKKIEDSVNELKNNNQNNTKQVYEDISKIYDYINSEINKKGCEINAVYNEISKNYHYTEELVAGKKAEVSEFFNNDKNAIWQKMYDLEKEIVVRYVTIKRLLDTQIDELNSPNNSEYTSKTLSESLDKIYSRLNDTSTMFYEELSKIYKELNDKLMKQKDEEKIFFENRLTDLRNEFDKKIEALKKELQK